MLTDIDSAMIQLYQATLPAMPTAYPNANFNEPANTVWAALANVKVTAQPITLGDIGEDEVLGYFQVAFNGPLNSGSANIETAREAIRSAFRFGKSVMYQGQQAQFISAKFPPVFRNGAYATGIVQIFWRARIVRSN